MSHETSSENRRVVVIQIDGSQSEAITPRTPAEIERMTKLREKYISAGLIPELPKPGDSAPPPQQSSGR